MRLLLEPGGRLRVYDGGELVATHDTAAPGGPIVYREGDYAEAMADKRWGGDADIEAQPGARGRPAGCSPTWPRRGSWS